ncbi:DUF423 domain-containing protein [Geminicoccus roseus]|uniref:DUF423 domain-containing protein n=1 Tax=Geminicoccus roseus TaxID=404900 RepID=UPI0003FE8156|nr:DUF423 domain-containing protein [Geminicoccus roseus]
MRRSQKPPRPARPSGPGTTGRAGPLLQAGAAIGAALAVMIGAMGAHAFRDAGDLRGAGLMETAGQYLMWHALAVLALRRQHDGLHRPLLLLLAASVLFSGTLVLLALGGPGWLGAITPVGGTGLIVGWILVAWVLLARPKTG